MDYLNPANLRFAGFFIVYYSDSKKRSVRSKNIVQRNPQIPVFDSTMGNSRESSRAAVR